MRNLTTYKLFESFDPNEIKINCEDILQELTDQGFMCDVDVYKHDKYPKMDNVIVTITNNGTWNKKNINTDEYTDRLIEYLDDNGFKIWENFENSYKRIRNITIGINQYIGMKLLFYSKSKNISESKKIKKKPRSLKRYKEFVKNKPTSNKPYTWIPVSNKNSPEPPQNNIPIYSIM